MPKTAFVCLVLLLLAGCATVMTDKQQAFLVTSKTPGAAIHVDGHHMGNTPATIQLDKTKDSVVVVTGADGGTYACMVTSSVRGGWVAADVLLAFVPLVVDAVTGEWKALDQEFCNAPL